MAKERTMAPDRSALATADDIRRILGTLDDAKLLDIVALRPTIVDVEEASLWLAGDPDVFGAGRPLQTVAGEVVAILTADEEEEPSPKS
jgi:hypothetical protein